jgi:hypothetical protein
MVGAVVLRRATQERGSQPDCATSIKNLSTGDGPSRLAMAPRHPTSCWRVLQPEWADTGRHIGVNPAPPLRTPFGERVIEEQSARSAFKWRHPERVSRAEMGLRRCEASPFGGSDAAAWQLRRSRGSRWLGGAATCIPCAFAPPVFRRPLAPTASTARRGRWAPPLRRNAARAKPRRSSGVPPPRWLTGAAPRGRAARTLDYYSWKIRSGCGDTRPRPGAVSSGTVRRRSTSAAIAAVPAAEVGLTSGIYQTTPTLHTRRAPWSP